MLEYHHRIIVETSYTGYLGVHFLILLCGILYIKTVQFAFFFFYKIYCSNTICQGYVERENAEISKLVFSGLNQVVMF